MHNDSLLDNPIWNALVTEHESFAVGTGKARRYPAEIGPLSGIADQSSQSYEDLRRLAGNAGVVALFQPEAQPTHPGWALVREAPMVQMVCLHAAAAGLDLPPAQPRLLMDSDVPAMVELAELTEPGPFGRRTSELGDFLGIFEGDRLVAMAGKRTRVPGFVEVSAVCTHPDARGRGYARRLICAVNDRICASGSVPYLHSLASNSSAIGLYRSLGFTLRRNLHLQVLRNAA